MDDRRKFFRILFEASAFITHGEHSWRTKILDLSLNGALIKRPDNFNQRVNSEFKLEFSLTESDIVVLMDATLAHKTPEHLGFKCHHIDVESISHLRRILELNAGDSDLLNRELEVLADTVQHD